MARLTSAEIRGQLSAIAQVRWHIFRNSLRTLGGRLELVSRIFSYFGFTVMGFGGAVGLAFGSWSFVHGGRVELLAILFWSIFLFWQLFPVMASAFAENIDSSNLLRFPLSFPSYFLVRVVFGASDPSTFVGSLWLLGLSVGVAVADLSLLPLTLLVCLLFAVFNLLLARAIFSWFERWLATRRAREIMGVVFLVFVISLQFLNPVLQHVSRSHAHPYQPYLARILPYERLLPPGLAASALTQARTGNLPLLLGALAVFILYSLVVLWILVVRLRSEFSGENLSEAAARSSAPVAKTGFTAGWQIPGLPGPVSAVVEKEFRYLSRSGPVLFTLVMPVVILLVFRFTPATSEGARSILDRVPDFVFPIGAAYALLIFTNILFNAFGAEGSGIQLYFLLPVRFSEILAAKNLSYSFVLALEMFFVWSATALIFRPPSLGITVATLAGVLFVFLPNLSLGNILSLYSPKKFDTAVLGRQRLPTASVFASMGVQAVVIGIAGLTLFVSLHWGNVWIAAVVLFALALVAFFGYLFSLRAVDRIALGRREQLLTELTRAS